MTDTEIIIEVAKLDGWEPEQHPSIPHYYRRKDTGSGCGREYFRYLTSRDAIVPVIEKLRNEKGYSSNPADYPTWMFSAELLNQLGLKTYDNGSPCRHPFDIGWLIIKATPRQLCVALLKATGKWKE